MKIVDAIWEKRNLGVTCVEIKIEKEDSIKDCIDKINGLKQQYQVVKIPYGQVQTLVALQDIGFRFIETSFNIGMDLRKPPQIPDKYLKVINDIKYHFASKEEEEEIIGLIENGEIFSTDRIALDPEFGRKIAGRRYAMWTRDLLASGGKLGVSEYDGERMGFSVDKYSESEKKFHTVLGGAFPNSVGTGLCAAGTYLVIQNAYYSGAKDIVSSVSSNNLPMLKIHLQAGMKIRDILYVLVRHK